MKVTFVILAAVLLVSCSKDASYINSMAEIEAAKVSGEITEVEYLQLKAQAYHTYAVRHGKKSKKVKPAEERAIKRAVKKELKK